MRTILALAAAAVLFTAPVTAEACSCIAPDIKQQWHEGADVLGLKIVAERTVGFEQQFAARVIQPFSGCLQSGDQVVLTTPFDSAACGTSLAVGETYILATHDTGATVAGRPARSISSCDWQSRYVDVGADDLDFLWSRPVECGGAITCADGVPPVTCLVDPCSLAVCPDGTCESNYCGGTCAAEFWDFDGYPVCEPW